MAQPKKISIVVPVYNEEATIENILIVLKNLKLDFKLQKQIVIVNDFTTDNSEQLIKEFIGKNNELDILYYKQDKNYGKGAALRKGFEIANGDLIIVQDADLEYDPNEFNILIKPIYDGFADVVYGSRFIGGKPHRILFFWHTLGNKLLTFLSNAMTNLNLTDMETCYKLFSSDVIKSIDLKENRFGFEPEVTAKIARIPKIRIYEVGISYYGRTYDEGKKIGWKDGFRAIYCILKYNLLSK